MTVALLYMFAQQYLGNRNTRNGAFNRVDEPPGSLTTLAASQRESKIA